MAKSHRARLFQTKIPVLNIDALATLDVDPPPMQRASRRTAPLRIAPEGAHFGSQFSGAFRTTARSRLEYHLHVSAFDRVSACAEPILYPYWFRSDRLTPR